jgi:hypothetical protein
VLPQAKPDQKPAPLHDPAAQAASFNQALHLTGAASSVSGVVKLAYAAPAGELGRSAK